MILAIWVSVRGGEKITGYPLGLGDTVDTIAGIATVGAILWLLALTARRAAANSAPPNKEKDNLLR